MFYCIRADNGLLPGAWQSYEHHFNGSFKALMKKSMTAGESVGNWSLTLAPTATGRPNDWTIAEAKLAPELKGDRREIVERTIHDTAVANLNTTNHSAEMVQRGFELYRAIGDSNGVSVNVNIKCKFRNEGVLSDAMRGQLTLSETKNPKTDTQKVTDNNNSIYVFVYSRYKNMKKDPNK